MTDPALASVRDPDKLAALSADERAGWEALWAEVKKKVPNPKPRKKPDG